MGEWCLPYRYRFKLHARAGSEATHQMSQGIPSLAATHRVLAHLCGGVASQAVVRLRPAEFIRPTQTKIWPCEGRALNWSGM